MFTLLFDIDGTLMSTGGAGMRAIGEAMKEMYGLDHLPKMDVHGRTDRFIFQVLLSHAGLDFDQHFMPLSLRYWELLPDTMRRSSGKLLPGVGDLLQTLSAESSVQIGLLTGNARRPAEIKLQQFGLESYFRFGGFGDEHACRNDVARSALQAAQTFLGSTLNTNEIWVIGDTVDDIRCARAIGAKVIAVETGGSRPEELRRASPDLQLTTLEQGFAELLTLFGPS